VRDHKKQGVIHQTKDLPSLLVVDSPILLEDRVWIQEHERRFVEADTVLSQVAGSFRRTPLEAGLNSVT
jgi:hypothetical protein